MKLSKILKIVLIVTTTLFALVIAVLVFNKYVDATFKLKTEIPIETIVVNENIEAENTEDIEELRKYKNLINNLNEYLSCVYSGDAYEDDDDDDYGIEFTGFSIVYNEKCYLITAGHTIEYEDIKYYEHSFYINYEWVYPELLAYSLTDEAKVSDYAIFYSDKVENGLDINRINSHPTFVLGAGDLYLNAIRRFGPARYGESGSPVMNFYGEVIGIDVGFFQDIDDVLDSIDNLQ